MLGTANNAASHGHGEFVVVTCGRWLPVPPLHDDFNELCRLQALWSRAIHWKGLTGLELLAKLDRQDMADCHAEVVIYKPIFECDEEFVPAIPLISPANDMAHYSPPVHDNPKRWMPHCPDRLDVAKQPALQARIVAAKIDRDIAEFFRNTDQLGAGNDESSALADFERHFQRDEETFKMLNSPVPHMPSSRELLKFYPDGGNSGGDHLGGRSIPR